MNKTSPIEPAKAMGRTVGCLSGTIGAGCMQIIGVLLCLTGIGAIVGIPLIIMGFAAPAVTGAITGEIMIKSSCPACGQAIEDIKKPGYDCPACGERLIAKEKTMYLARDIIDG